VEDLHSHGGEAHRGVAGSHACHDCHHIAVGEDLAGAYPTHVSVTLGVNKKINSLLEVL
jgi:hypothetical protein